MYKIPSTTLTPITDDLGRIVAHEFAEQTQDLSRPFDVVYVNEPLPGSIVLTSGLHGTAWQRHHDDGMWHPASRGGRSRPWHYLLQRRLLTLVYAAEERA